MNKKQAILIVDDSEDRREMLKFALEQKYEIFEAPSGEEALFQLTEHGDCLSAVLLDIHMYEVSGIDVLKFMNKTNLIERIPTIIISQDKTETSIAEAYELGVMDYIDFPFEESLVQKRVEMVTKVHEKQRQLENAITAQLFENGKTGRLMTAVLSHIVESRHGLEKDYILQLGNATKVVLKHLKLISNKYSLTPSQIDGIASASALHDIGKIAIPDEILSKKEPLTPEELEVMRRHPLAGADILTALPVDHSEFFVKTAGDICRSHHERYDGSGFPLGLKGDEIPISAQVVGLLEAFCSLVHPHEQTGLTCKEAFEHIQSEAAHKFNPLLLQALEHSLSELKEAFFSNDIISSKVTQEYASSLIEKEEDDEDGFSSENFRMLNVLKERVDFFSQQQSLTFSHAFFSDQLTFSKRASELLQLPTVITHPRENKVLKRRFGERWAEDFKAFRESLKEQDDFTYESTAAFPNAETIKVVFKGRFIRSEQFGDQILGVIGSIEPA